MNKLAKRALATVLGAAWLLLGVAACSADIPGIAEINGNWLLVQAFTEGANADPDGYVVSLDGGAVSKDVEATALDYANFDLSVGSHTVELTGIAANCAIALPQPPGPGDSTSPVTVNISADAVTVVNFRLSCP